MRLLLATLFAFAAFSQTGLSAQSNQSKDSAALSELSVAGKVGGEGDFSDLFRKLKEHPDFLRLSEKHGLDDPARWPTLRQRFVLNSAELRGNLMQAQSMMEAEDRRSGLDGKLVSAESTRKRGRELSEHLQKQIDELRQMLRLIDEMEAALDEQSPLTEEIRLENQSGQSFNGRALLIDGNDLIIKRGQATYFRVPSAMLNDRTKRKIVNEVFADWEELPDMDFDPYADEEDRETLIAYDDSRLYIKVPGQGTFSEERREGETVTGFVPYAARMEASREALLAADRKEKAALELELRELEAAQSLNQSRVERIRFYENRLSTEVPGLDG